MQLLQIDNEIELGCVAQKVNTFLKMTQYRKEWPTFSSFLSDHNNVSR